MFNITPQSFDDLLICMAVVVCGLILTWGIASGLKFSKFHAVALYFYHMILCFVMLVILTQRGGDSLGYYLGSFDRFQEIGFGTAFLTAFTGIFSNSLNFSFLATSLVFNVIGSIGLLLFAASIFPKVNNRNSVSLYWLALMMVFMPSLSLWTSPIGKDSIAVLGIGLFCWGMRDFNSRLLAIFAGIIFLVFIRPHVGLAMAGCAYAFAAFNIRKSPVRVLLILVLGFFALLALLPVVASKLSLESLNAEQLEQFIGKREATSAGGSGIELSSMSLPMKVVTYLLRPMIFEAGDLLQLMSAIENLIHTLLLGYFVVKIANRRMAIGTFELLLIGFSIAILVLFALTTPNLGIAVRQKWMLLVPLYVALFSAANRYVTPHFRRAAFPPGFANSPRMMQSMPRPRGFR